MDYSKLRKLILVKDLTIEKISVMIGRSRNWFKMAEANDSMAVKDLEAVLKVLEMTVPEFYGEKPQFNLSEPTVSESKWLAEKMELLEENRQLRLRIDQLEGKRGNGSGEAKAKLYK